MPPRRAPPASGREGGLRPPRRPPRSPRQLRLRPRSPPGCAVRRVGPKPSRCPRPRSKAERRAGAVDRLDHGAGDTDEQFGAVVEGDVIADAFAAVARRVMASAASSLARSSPRVAASSSPNCSIETVSWEMTSEWWKAARAADAPMNPSKRRRHPAAAMMRAASRNSRPASRSMPRTRLHRPSSTAAVSSP